MQTEPRKMMKNWITQIELKNNVLLIDRGHTLIITAESQAGLLKSGVSVFSVPWNLSI